MENNKVYVCEECGREFTDESELREVDGELYCNDCFDENFFICDHCGSVCSREEENAVFDMNDNISEVVCDNCCENGYYHCCEDCGRLIDESDSLCIDGNWICDNCRDTGDYGTCENCGDWHHIDNLYYDDRDCCYYCEYCYNEESDIISDYHCHDNTLEFFGDDKNNTVPYLGVELEIDKGIDADECAEYTKSIFPDNFIYFESDGSLSSYGFENITQPATLEYHLGLKNTYKDMFSNAVRLDYRSHNTSTCGLHVHFNRDFFEENEELYVTRLLYIVERFWNELTKFSRRSILNLQRWGAKYDETPEDVVKTWKTEKWNLNRYKAVNLTNDDTIEFRMFRGTLKLNTFIATLQLCHTLIMTAKNIDTEKIQSLRWEDLLQYDEIKAYWEEVKNRQ